MLDPMRAPRRRLAPPLAAALAATALLAPPSSANNGVALLANSARSYGRGGAETAVGDDALTSPSNPATIMESGRLRVDGSLTTAFERVRTTTAFEDSLDTNLIGIPFPALGAIWDPFADDPTEEVPDPAPSRGRIAFALWQPIGLVISPSVSFAGQVNDWLSIGVSVQPLITYLNLTIVGTAGAGEPGAEPDFLPNGTVRIHRDAGGEKDPPEVLTDSSGDPVTWADIFRLANGVGFDPTAVQAKPILELDVRETTGFGIMGQIGAFARPHPDLGIGLSLRSPGVVFEPRGKAFVDLSGAVDAIRANPQVGQLLDAAFDTYLPAGGRNGYEAEYDLKGSNIVLPWAIFLGIAWRPVDDVLVAADARFISWTDASGEIKLTGQRGSNADFNEINGGPGITYTVEIEWKDQIVLAGGVAWSPLDWLALRCGWNYGRNPMSKDFLLGNSLGTEHHATVGAGFLLGSLTLDLAYVYGLPYQVDYGAVSQRSTSEQHFFVVGAGYRF
jgi:hypothetical protein